MPGPNSLAEREARIAVIQNRYLKRRLRSLVPGINDLRVGTTLDSLIQHRQFRAAFETQQPDIIFYGKSAEAFGFLVSSKGLVLPPRQKASAFRFDELGLDALAATISYGKMGYAGKLKDLTKRWYYESDQFQFKTQLIEGWETFAKQLKEALGRSLIGDRIHPELVHEPNWHQPPRIVHESRKSREDAMKFIPS